jgi:membrane fusion protein (multidrug efflux system)
MSDRRTTVRPLGVLALAFAALTAAACHKAEATPEARPAETKIHVDTQVVTEQTVPTLLTVPGSVEANMRTDLAANSEGRVIRTFVERGDHVKAGQVLAQLDARGAELSEAQAVANAKSASDQLANDKADCDRYDKLLARGAITKQEYDKQRTTCATQSASEEVARAKAADSARALSDAAIRAPFAGAIGERFVSVGDYVHADTKVVTLLVDDPLRIELTVPEASISYAEQGVTFSFETVSRPGKAFQATIKYVGKEVRATTRDLVVEAVGDNADHALLPGMFVTAHLKTGERTLPLVPASSVLAVDNTSTVLVVVDGHLQQRTVQTGATVGDRIAILDGVKKDEQVVVKPAPEAVDGVAVDAVGK